MPFKYTKKRKYSRPRMMRRRKLQNVIFGKTKSSNARQATRGRPAGIQNRPAFHPGTNNRQGNLRGYVNRGRHDFRTGYHGADWAERLQAGARNVYQGARTAIGFMMQHRREIAQAAQVASALMGGGAAAVPMIGRGAPLMIEDREEL